MISLRSALLSLLALGPGGALSACDAGGPDLDAAASDAAASDVAASDAAARDAAASDAAASDAAASDAAASDAAAPGDGSVDAATREDARAPTEDASAPGGPVRLEIREPYAYGNCFGGPPDPLLAFWTLRAEGPSGERVTVERASLVVQVPSTGYSETQALTIDVPTFTIGASGTTSQEQRKTSGAPSIPVCTFCGMTVAGELVLEVSTSGGTERVSASLSDVGCVF
jgi:hypothetical protein